MGLLSFLFPHQSEVLHPLSLSTASVQAGSVTSSLRASSGEVGWMLQDVEVIVQTFLSVFPPWSISQYAWRVPAVVRCQHHLLAGLLDLLQAVDVGAQSLQTTSTHTVHFHYWAPLTVAHAPHPRSAPLAGLCQVLPVTSTAWLIAYSLLTLMTPAFFSVERR